MRSLLIHLVVLLVWFLGIVAFVKGQDVRPAIREEVSHDVTLEPGWTLEKDGSYVRTLRRPTKAQTAQPKTEAKLQAAPRKLVTPPTVAARSVPSTRTFPSNGVQFDPDHRCDKCGHESAPGTGTWLIASYNADGTHNHKCPRCGNVWKH